MTKEEILAILKTNSGLYQSYPEAMFLVCWAAGNAIITKLLNSSCDDKRLPFLCDLVEIKSRLNMFVTALNLQTKFDQARPDHLVDTYQKIIESWYFIYENYDSLVVDKDWKENFTKEQVENVCIGLLERQEQHKKDLQKKYELRIYENELDVLALLIDCAFRFLLGRLCQEFIEEYNAAIEILRQLQTRVLNE